MSTKLRYSHFILSIIFIFSMSSTSYADLPGGDNAAQLIDDLALAIGGCDVEAAKHLIGSSPTLATSSITYSDEETYTILDFAVINKGVEIVKYLLEKGATLTTTGVTTLHKAAKSGNKEITEIILNHSNGENLLNAKDPKGHTPLHYAVIYKPYNRKFVEYLIDQGAELYSTLLHDVVSRIDDCESIIDEILKRKPELLNAQNEKGFTPFMRAVNENKERAMRHLLEKGGLDLTKKDTKEQATALAWAVYFNRPIDIIINMLNKNPQLLNERSKGEKSLLRDAINMHMKGNESDGYRLNREAIINELLRRKPDFLTDLFAAVRLHDRIGTDGIENLIKKGAALYPTLLHDVVSRIDDCESIIDEILKRKPDLLNVQDEDGFTPFMLAVEKNREKAMKHLLTKGTLDLTKKDTKEQATALAWAVYFNRPIDIIIDMLNKYPQLLNECSKGGKSLLHEAINMKENGNESDEDQLNREAIIKELLRCKPDLISLQDGNDKTPLQYAQELSIRDRATICALLETAEKTALQPVTLAPRTDLFTAVRLHDRIGTDGTDGIDGIENLIKKGAELYPTLLHDVVTYIDDCESIIDEILKRKPELLNAQNKVGFTPFMRAVSESRERAMRHLLKKGGLDLTKKDEKEYSNALAWAIYYNRPIDIIIGMLDNNPQLLNERSKGEKSLLHEAINMHMKGNESDGYCLNRKAIINELLRRKPDLISLQDGKDKTPLQYAQELSISDKATICARLETAEKSLPQSSSITIDGQLQDTTSERGKKLAVGLIGVSLAIGIAYGVKKMRARKSKPTKELEDKGDNDQKESSVH